MPSFINVGPAVLEPQDFENVDSVVRTDGWTFWPVLQSFPERWVKILLVLKNWLPI